MARFAKLQRRNPQVKISWATPPLDNRNWFIRHLWPAGTRPVVVASSSAKGGPKVIIAGVAKGLEESHVQVHIPKLITLGETFGDYHIVVYENNSPRVSRHAMCDALAATSKSSFLFEDLLPGRYGGRTTRIARARNVVLDYIEHNTEGFDYLLMTDMDGVCGGTNPELSFDTRVFAEAFSRAAEWESLSFVFEPYWDMWAFRQQDVHPYDHFGMDKDRNRIQDMDSLTLWIHDQPPGELITVDSAFMMLAIYKLSSIDGCRYAGSESSKSILASFLSSGPGATTCEHAPFHQCMRERNNARIRILPKVYCEGDPGWIANGSTKCGVRPCQNPV